MNKTKKINFKEYSITIFMAFLIMLAIGFVVEIDLLFKCEKSVNFSELNTENLAKFCTIEELEKQLKKTPDDVILNIRLAKMYESLDKLDKANDFYKSALSLSSRSNFALYSYAMFCAKHDMYVFAAMLAEEMNGNNKKTNFFRAKIYEQIADSLDKSKNYPACVKSYQIAYKYAKSLGDLKYLKQIKEKYSISYINLADYNMELEEVQNAISNLKNSLKIKKNALANYKLGLIYLSEDKRTAEKYINKAFFENPYIVNPYIYNNLLQEIIKETQILGKENLSNYYNIRLVKFKNKVKEAYLYKDEILIDNSILLSEKSRFGKIKKKLFFELKNNTKEPMNNLYLKVELHINNEKHIFERKVLSQTHALDAYDVLEYKDLILPDEIKLNDLNKNDIFVRYFAKKAQNAPWILIKIDFINI